MAQPPSLPLVAVDIGNTRIKLGEFEGTPAAPLPLPVRSLAVSHQWTSAELDPWLATVAPDSTWSIASVHRGQASRMVEWLRNRAVSNIHMLGEQDLPLVVELERPDHVGIDRLATAVAVNCLRASGCAAVVIGMGSANTVDLVSNRGTFMGGTILPGMQMSARALHEFTDLVPLVETVESPDVLGKSTVEAVRSGLFWGTLGAIRELTTRLAAGQTEVQVFLTGGTASTFAAIMSEASNCAIQYAPHLTLSGIAVAMMARERPQGVR
jgi:type III pantothenate kinase